MQRRTLLVLLLALIAAIGGEVRSAEAYSRYSVDKDATNCRACHGSFTASPYVSLADGQSWGDSLHNVHRTTMLNNDCSVCHFGRKFPVLLNDSNGGIGLAALSCMGCHGRAEDDGAANPDTPDLGGYGAGLRQHHTWAGVYVCLDCHADADPFSYTPVGEEVLPPYYANPGTSHPNMPVDPCNLDGSEDFAATTIGLDNDGDGLYDGLDSGGAASLPDIAVSALLLDFGVVTAGSSADQVVTVSNAGSADLTLGAVAAGDPLAAPFGIAPGGDTCSGALLAPAESCTLTLRFAPDAVAPFDESFDIPSDDPDENPVTVSLAGTGTALPAPDIAVSDSLLPVDDLRLDFGIVRIGRTADQLVTVSNAGSADLQLGAVASGDPLDAPFGLAPGGDTCSGALLAPAESCTLTLRFAPDAASAFSETFDIPSDDPDENPLTVTLAGTGIANSPPSQPPLVGPSDGALELEAPLTFSWDPSSDPDGDALSYDLFVCSDSSFATCTPVNPAPITLAAVIPTVAFASAGFGMACFGVAFAGGLGRRRRLALLAALALGLAVSLAACGGGGGGGGSPAAPALPAPSGQVSFTTGGLASATTYYWKVVASDGSDSTDSEVRSFTTL